MAFVSKRPDLRRPVAQHRPSHETCVAYRYTGCCPGSLTGLDRRQGVNQRPVLEWRPPPAYKGMSRLRLLGTAVVDLNEPRIGLPQRPRTSYRVAVDDAQRAINDFSGLRRTWGRPASTSTAAGATDYINTLRPGCCTCLGETEIGARRKYDLFSTLRGSRPCAAIVGTAHSLPDSEPPRSSSLPTTPRDRAND